VTAVAARPVARADDPVPDERLLARVAGGDRDALGELYRRHRGTVRGYVRARISRADDAEDVVHDTFLRAARQAGEYRAGDPRPVSQWLCYHAAWQLREHGHRVGSYLAAAREASAQMERPVTESAEAREATPLSEPVREALAKLTPGERRAIQLRYLDGYTPDQAAQIVGVRRRSFHRRVEYGRRKLARELADHAPQPRSDLVDLPRRDAITRALGATGNDVPAATAWLRKRGVHASTSNLYRHRQAIEAGQAPVVHARPSRLPERPAYTPPDHVTQLPTALERASAVSVDYRTRFGHLPTRREVMTAAAVSESTATRALRPLKADPTAGTARSEQPRPPARADGATHAPPGPRPRALTPTRQTGTERPDPHPRAQDATSDRDTQHGDAAIEHARTALAVLAADRQLRTQRHAGEQTRSEQLNRWHHDDAQQAAARAREDWGMAR
jgi:RNA polymerase sigma-70 factor (ECF subfamily)